jgi:sugar/nucleoside kinase (ribokinase family)
VNLAISLKKIFRMKKILGIGNALVDVMTPINDDQILDKFSLPKGSMQLVDAHKSAQIKTQTNNFKKTFSSGGSAANTIHGLAMMGVATGFIGSIGKDDAGDVFEKDMKQAGVNTMLFRRDSATGTAVALISKDSERTFATHLGAALELDAADLNPLLFDNYDILYLEGYLINNMPLVETACKIAKKKGMTIALDLASYNVVEANLPGFKKIAGNYVDIIFANEEEARAFTGLLPEKALEQLSENSQIAIVKIGPEGSWLKKGEQIIKIGSLPVKCKDTTGAGDLYASGFLYGHANNLDLEKCGLLGALLAGNVISFVGAKIKDEKWPAIRKHASVITNK